MAQRVPSRFRAFLRGELAAWRAEGIVDAAAAEAIARRYALDEPDGAGLALGALYVLASALVGAGVISLVAWHWEETPEAVRLLLLGTTLVAAHLSGYWMWKVTGKQPRLGHAISLLGTLVFGASIGLVAQIFHLSGVWYRFFGAWAVGALAAGVALPSLPALGFAFILALYVWAPGYLFDRSDLGEMIAWCTGGTAVALAFTFRSRVLFLLAYVGLGLLLAFAVSAHGGSGWEELLLGLVAWLAAAACALGIPRAGARYQFAIEGGILGRSAFYALGYLLSFHSFTRGSSAGLAADGPRGWLTCALPVALAALALLVVGLRSRAAWPARVVGVVAAVFAALLFLLVQILRDLSLVAVLANAAVLALAGVRMAQGLRERRRGPFWEGLVVVAVVAVSRFFEIESMLWLKGAGFIACGVGVIVGGLTFERRLRAGGSEVGHA
jgi:uncharacterized membrane protein